MNWPWVSRLAYNVVREENDRLRTQNDGLIDHLTRMDRREHGLGETQPSAKPREPMSPEVLAEIKRWKRPGTRTMRLHDAQRLYAQGKDHNEVLAALREGDEAEET